MRRIVAVSDSHGMESALCRTLAAAFARGPVDAAVFLGDGAEEWARVSNELLRAHPGLLVFGVKGNNDWCANLPPFQTFRMGGVCFALCHGHRQQVKYGLDRLYFFALEQEARVVLYGHTHESNVMTERGITFVNPGAVSGYWKGTPPWAEILVGDDGEIQAKILP